VYSRVFVLIPFAVAPCDIWKVAHDLLDLHGEGGPNQNLERRFDRLSGKPGTFADIEAEGLLPKRDKRALQGRITIVQRLSPNEVAAALVLPNGEWHDISDYGWRMMADDSIKRKAEIAWQQHFSKTVLAYPHHYVFQTWVHS
jgi:hypothetical protein